MRPIKFRAWIKSEKRLVNNLDAIYPNGKLVGTLGELHDGPWKYENIELMQFTGLHDKKGKESYFDDLIHILGDEWVSEGIYQVTWDRYEIKLVLIKQLKRTKYSLDNDVIYKELGGLWIEHAEIIGNVFQNPELLKET